MAKLIYRWRNGRFCQSLVDARWCEHAAEYGDRLISMGMDRWKAIYLTRDQLFDALSARE